MAGMFIDAGNDPAVLADLSAQVATLRRQVKEMNELLSALTIRFEALTGTPSSTPKPTSSGPSSGAASE